MRIVVALPVLNEEKVLARTVGELERFLDREMAGYDRVIVIADNGSEDATAEIAAGLVRGSPRVRYMRIAARGKGRAIREAWSSEDADVYAFMDADLATDLSSFPALVGAVAAGADVAAGSRAHPRSVVRRSPIRRALSFGYRALLRGALGTSVADAPCGFKAVSPRVVADVLPSVADDRWFFDTELLMRAERAGLRIAEVPVIWREEEPEGRRSRVDIPRLVVEYVRKVMRLRRDLRRR